MSGLEIEGPPILARIEPEDNGGYNHTLSQESASPDMPSLQKVESGDSKTPVPFKQYQEVSKTNENQDTAQKTSVIPIVVTPMAEDDESKNECDKKLNNESQREQCQNVLKKSSMILGKSEHTSAFSKPLSNGNQNGKVPLARDVDMSLLKLAYKLKQAIKKLEKKKSMSQVAKDTPFKVVKNATNNLNGNAKSLSSSVINPGNPVTVSVLDLKDTRNILTSNANKSKQVSLLKPIPLTYFQTNKGETKSASTPSESNVVVKIPQSLLQIKPITKPKRPTKSLQLLTGLKYKLNYESEPHLPKSTGLPLWPVFSATRDGGRAMDTSFLDRYITSSVTEEPEQACTSTRAGRLVTAPDRLQCEEMNESMDAAVSDNGMDLDPDHYINFTNPPVSVDIPEDLDEMERDAIEDLAFDTLAAQYVPRAAKKAIDITKVVIDITRRQVLQNYTAQLKAAKAASFAPIKIATMQNASSPVAKQTSTPVRKVDDVTSRVSLTPQVKEEPKTSSEQDVALSVNTIPIPVTRQEVPNPWKISGQTNNKEISPIQLAEGGVIPRKYKCPSCKYQTDNRSHLRRHESSVHSGEKIYECYICKIDFARSEKCKAHMMKLHPEVQYDPRMIRKDKTYFNKPTPMNETLKEQLGLTARINENGSLDLSMKKHSTPIKIEGLSETDYSVLSADGSFDLSSSTQFDGDDSLSSSSNVPLPLCVVKATSPRSLLAWPQNGVGGLGSPPAPPKFQCPQCSYAGKDAWHVKRHIQDVHNNRKAYQCKMCSYVTSRKHRLISHMKGHGTLSCLYCDYATPDYDTFLDHLKLCSAAQKLGGLTCRICQHAFFNRKILADHMLRLHETLLYTCDMCYFNTTDAEEFEDHNNKHLKITPQTANTTRTCSKCGDVFKTERQYEHHMMSTHKTDVDFDIDGTFLEERDGAYICLICAFETTEKESINAHIEHHKAKWFRCDIPECTFVAATKKALNKHKASAHLDLLQAAPFTKAVPAIPSDSSHIYDKETGGLQGHGSGMWQCHICPDKTLYRYRRSYEKHMAKHQGYVEPSIEVQSHRSLPILDPEALTCLMCGAQGWADRAQLQAHLFQSHGIDAFDHQDDDSHGSSEAPHSSAAHSPTALAMATAHSPRMSDAHMQMLRQIAANATSPVHMAGPVAWPEPETAPSTHAQWHRPENQSADSKAGSDSNPYSHSQDNGNTSLKLHRDSTSSSPKSHYTKSAHTAVRESDVQDESVSSQEEIVTSSKRGLPSEDVTSQRNVEDSSEEEEWPSEWQSSAPKRLKTG